MLKWEQLSLPFPSPEEQKKRCELLDKLKGSGLVISSTNQYIEIAGRVSKATRRNP